MQCTTLSLLGLASLAAAAPTLMARQSITAITDTLLFSSSMATFQAARNAQNPPNLDWSSNGCSYSPDEPFGFDFTPSCQRHDFGYRNTKVQGRFDALKDRIDSNFKADLYNECAKSGQPAKTVCEATANVYYEAVSTFGKRDEEGGVVETA